MNRDNYKKAFSQVSPSDEAIGRIFDMTEQKPKKFRLKGILIAAAVIILMMCLLVGVDAATGGDVFKLTINGEQVNAMDYFVRSYTYTNESGQKVHVQQFRIEHENGDEAIFYINIDVDADDEPEDVTEVVIVEAG